MIEVDYACADGTPLRVRFDDADQAARHWRLEREHNPERHTPLMQDLSRLQIPGSRRAYAELDLPIPPAFDASPNASGFAYMAEEFVAPDDMPKMVAGISRLVVEHGSALGLWHGYCLPRSRAAVAMLDAADGQTALAVCAEEHAYGQQMTMMPAFVCGNDLTLLTASIADIFGEQSSLVAYELTQGHGNETLRADQWLFELGRTVAASSTLSRAVAASDAAAEMRLLHASGAESEFFSELDRFLADFGGRGETWDIAAPTWNEQQNGFWRQLAQLSSPDALAPSDALAKGAQRRESLGAEIVTKLAHDPEKQARFQRRYERIRHYVAVREERALWQLILTGSLRRAGLRRGEGLVQRGVLDTADDVLYLHVDEIEAAAGDLRALVAERRAEHDFWRTKTPPPVVGGADVAPGGPPTLPDDRILRGVAGSRGIATGHARIVNDLDDADHVEPGDVLVCVMTAPPWTPLFGIAAAVVVDSGDLGSHPAIAAREYGIPCVLATRIGTAVIPDGAMITVDGEQGTVQVAP